MYFSSNGNSSGNGGSSGTLVVMVSSSGNCTPADRQSSSVFTIFLYCLTRLRPDVKLSIEEVPNLLAKFICTDDFVFDQDKPLST